MKPEKIILATANHPLFKSLSQLPYRFLEVNLLHPNWSFIETEKTVEFWDFCLLPGEQKKQLLGELKAPTYSDLSCYHAEHYHIIFSHLKASFATAFHSPHQTYEAYGELENVELFFKELSIHSKAVSSPGIGFTFPRIISQVINEAYFAIQEKVASAEHIDTAMSYGVNYPKGPIQWCREIGAEKVAWLLEELYRETGQPRYRLAMLLKQEACQSFSSFDHNRKE